MTTLLLTLNSLCASYLVSLGFSFLSYKTEIMHPTWAGDHFNVWQNTLQIIKKKKTEIMTVPVAIEFLRGLNR